MGVLVAQFRLLPPTPPYTPINPATLNLPPIIPPPDQANMALLEQLNEFYEVLQKKRTSNGEREENKDSRSPSPNRHRKSHHDDGNDPDETNRKANSPRGSGKLGLGAHEEQSDPFQVYRKSKSYTYRQ